MRSIIAKLLGIFLILLGIILFWSSMLIFSENQEIKETLNFYFFGFDLGAHINSVIMLIYALVFVVSGFCICARIKKTFYFTIGFFILDLIGSTGTLAVLRHSEEMSAIISDVIILLLLFLIKEDIMWEKVGIKE